jgi:hypothetical protein
MAGNDKPGSLVDATLSRLRLSETPTIRNKSRSASHLDSVIREGTVPCSVMPIEIIQWFAQPMIDRRDEIMLRNAWFCSL